MFEYFTFQSFTLFNWQAFAYIGAAQCNDTHVYVEWSLFQFFDVVFLFFFFFLGF